MYNNPQNFLKVLETVHCQAEQDVSYLSTVLPVPNRHSIFLFFKIIHFLHKMHREPVIPPFVSLSIRRSVPFDHRKRSELTSRDGSQCHDLRTRQFYYMPKYSLPVLSSTFGFQLHFSFHFGLHFEDDQKSHSPKCSWQLMAANIREPVEKMRFCRLPSEGSIWSAKVTFWIASGFYDSTQDFQQ